MKILGIDECGAGSWAGELIVCGFVADKEFSLQGLNDSKKLTSKKRAELNKLLSGYEFYVKEITSREVDEMGLGKALLYGYQEVFNKLYCKDLHVIVDGNKLKPINDIKDATCESIVGADGSVPHVSAASIIGKEYHDKLMREKHSISYPEFKFDKHVGYGTKDHLEAIKKYGITPIHRLSYKPIQKMIAEGCRMYSACL